MNIVWHHDPNQTLTILLFAKYTKTMWTGETEPKLQMQEFLIWSNRNLLCRALYTFFKLVIQAYI